ncbi:rod shape-determining protein MreC [Candidatus Pelagibacter sp.]|jgi:rod shape-determining protein MreC|nr:rod shape-determining protein MreC [Candidatus Pelagibacter sp.]
MALGRDDFIIAFRSAFLKKKDKQRFSLLTLIFLSIIVIILGHFNLKAIKFIKIGINEVIYRSSFIVSVPENYFQKINIQFKDHMNLYENYKNKEIELKKFKQNKLSNNFLILENKKLRNLINESINSDDIFAKVLIDKKSPYLKSIVLNKGSKEKVKIGMAILDGVYLVGQVIEVNYTSSRALLMSDLNSKIPVLIEPLGIQAVASGTGKNYGEIEYTKEEFKDKIGSKEMIVYTSGLGGLFKPGLPIGKINNDIKSKINFFSDFTQLDYVKIVSYNFSGGK